MNFVNEPLVHHGDLMDGLPGNSLAKCLRDHPDSLIIHDGQANEQLLLGQMAEVIAVQRIHMLLQRTECLHQASLEAGADAHHFARCLHLRSQRSLGMNELVKGEPRELHHAVIQSRFKRRIGFAGYRVLNLVQRKAQCDLGRHLCNRISRCLGSQCRRAGHTRIHLDNAILKAGRVQCELHVAAAGNLQLVDDIQCRCTQHLIFLIGKRLGRSHNNGISRMYTNRIDIFHVADCNAVARTVTHHLVLDFLPAGNAALHQHLAHAGQAKTVFKNLTQLCRVVCNAAAGAAQCIGRAQNHRKPDFLRKSNTVLYVLYNLGGSDRLTDLLHRLLEHFTVFCLFNGKRRGSEKLYAVGIQKSGFRQLHAKVEPRLSAKGRQNGVRFFLLNNFLQDLRV